MKRVYFIKPIGMDGPIKIGCSFSPETRRRSLETWSPFALEIVAEIDGDNDLENRFHALFMETHQRREWFGWSKRLAATIEAIKNGQFDVATLPSPIVAAAVHRSGKGSRANEWGPGRRFSAAYNGRLKALQRRGMSRVDAPQYYHWFDVEDLPGHIRACEAFADEMTAKYGHDKIAPVRWVGAFPTPNTEKAA